MVWSVDAVRIVQAITAKLGHVGMWSVDPTPRVVRWPVLDMNPSRSVGRQRLGQRDGQPGSTGENPHESSGGHDALLGIQVVGD